MTAAREDSKPPFLEPLSFQLEQSQDGSTSLSDNNFPVDPFSLTCLFCEQSFEVSSSKDEFLRHLVLIHKLVIADVKLIADFKRYLEYWRQRFKEKPLTDFCTVIQTNSKDTDIDPKEYYYLLCDVLPEDKEIRIKLQQEKLKDVLEQQQRERDDADFSRSCLFCKEHFEGNRAELFNHMAQEHAFNVGQADNLVYTKDFLDILQQKLQSLQCLYCERTFKDKHVLKEHMRKKQHRKINPKNVTYDRFYIINYLELGKNWESLQSEEDEERRPVTDDEDDVGFDASASANNDDWSEWTDSSGAQAVCLFCSTTSSVVEELSLHMKDTHHFDMQTLKAELNLDFYQQVKLINYIRRQIHQNICPSCQEVFASREEMREHLQVKGHTSVVPDLSVWDQPQYFFPTFEDDNLLCALEDDDVDDDAGDTAAAAAAATPSGTSPAATSSARSVVIAEDLPVKDSILAAEGVRQQLLS